MRLTEAQGRKIRVYLDASGVTLTAFAGSIGISQPHLSGILLGKRDVGRDVLGRIAEGLRMSTYQLLDIEPPDSGELGNKREGPRKSAAIKEFRSAETMRAHPAVFEYLQDEVKRLEPLYPYPRQMLTRIIGRTTVPTPVSVFGTDGEIVLGSLDLRTARIPGSEHSEYVEKRRLVSRSLFGSGLIYTGKDIKVDGGVCVINGGVADYFSVLTSQNAMEHELLLEAYRLAQLDDLTVTSLRSTELPRRAQYLQRSPIERRRFASLGLSTVLIYNSADGYRIMIRKRSKDTAVHPNLFHVIPSCNFSPELNPEREWHLLHCVIKEYCEELFDLNVDPKRWNSSYFYEEWAPAQNLLEALKTGICEFFVTGIAFHLLSFRMDICTVLLVRDAEWFRVQSNKFHPNWEHLAAGEMLQLVSAMACVDFHLDRVEDEFLASASALGLSSGSAIGGAWVPSGLAALWLGVDAARKRLSR